MNMRLFTMVGLAILGGFGMHRLANELRRRRQEEMQQETREAERVWEDEGGANVASWTASGTPQD